MRCACPPESSHHKTKVFIDCAACGATFEMHPHGGDIPECCDGRHPDDLLWRAEPRLVA